MRPLMIGTLILLGCGPAPAPEAPAPEGTPLRNSAGQTIGGVSLRQSGDRVEIRVRVNDLPPGTHGMHLHEIGRCQTPGFQSAGPHLNPGGTKRHGRRHPQGHHQGDLGNIQILPDRRGDRTASVSAPGGILLLLGGLGRSLVIHRNPDDELTQPDGKSGPRIACAELGR